MGIPKESKDQANLVVQHFNEMLVALERMAEATRAFAKAQTQFTKDLGEMVQVIRELEGKGRVQ